MNKLATTTALALALTTTNVFAESASDKFPNINGAIDLKEATMFMNGKTAIRITDAAEQGIISCEETLTDNATAFLTFGAGPELIERNFASSMIDVNGTFGLVVNNKDGKAVAIIPKSEIKGHCSNLKL